MNLGTEPGSLIASLREEIDEPLSYERYRMTELTVSHRIVYDVRANWKILVDNFNECLHCPGIHPELTRIVPIYRKGMVIEERDDGCTGVRLAEGHARSPSTGPPACPPSPGSPKKTSARTTVSPPSPTCSPTFSLTQAQGRP